MKYFVQSGGSDNRQKIQITPRVACGILNGEPPSSTEAYENGLKWAYPLFSLVAEEDD